jgi:argininosuccinate synthase
MTKSALILGLTLSVSACAVDPTAKIVGPIPYDANRPNACEYSIDCRNGESVDNGCTKSHPFKSDDNCWRTKAEQEKAEENWRRKYHEAHRGPQPTQEEQEEIDRINAIKIKDMARVAAYLALQDH